MEYTQEQLKEISINIPMYKIISSNISGIGYDENLKVLKVLFKGNSCYMYFNISKDVYDTIMNSESKGKALNECVVRQKDKYKFIKL